MNLTESVHNTTQHLNPNLSFDYFFSVPLQAAALLLCFHTPLLPQLSALT